SQLTSARPSRDRNSGPGPNYLERWPAPTASKQLRSWPRIPRRQHALDGAHDAHVAGAAAEVARELLADARFVGVGKTQDDVARGDQHSRRAVAALQRVLGGERGAQLRHHRILGEALDRAHLGAFAGEREGDARSCRRAVDLERAGAAHAVLAAEVGAGESGAL